MSVSSERFFLAVSVNPVDAGDKRERELKSLFGFSRVFFILVDWASYCGLLDSAELTSE